MTNVNQRQQAWDLELPETVVRAPAPKIPYPEANTTIRETRKAAAERLNTMKEQRIRADYEKALYELDELEAFLAMIGAQSAHPQIELTDIEAKIRTDIGGDKNKLREFEAFLERMKSNPPLPPIGFS